MKVTCEDRERLFIDGSAEEWLALEQHCTNCAACAEDVRSWKQLSVVATELRDYQENPLLWTRIQSSLVEEKSTPAKNRSLWESTLEFLSIPKLWQLGFAAAMVLVLTLTAGYLFLHRPGVQTAGKTGLLKDDTLASVERTEREYMKAIDKLASEAKPQMEGNNSPLMASYQEKLLVLDSAIDELRAEAGQNPSNAHLRYQLLTMYEQKEATLRDILETKR